MPTLADLLPTEDATTPAPTLPAPRSPIWGEAVLPEAAAQVPPSATQAMEQLARQRYGDTFVDQYGDVLGVRPSGFGDRLRNVVDIMTSGPQAARGNAFMGAQMRAGLNRETLAREAETRRQLLDLMDFPPQAIRSGMSPRLVGQMFSEQYQTITGQPPHPSVLDALLELERNEQEPFGRFRERLLSGEMTRGEVQQVFGDLGQGMRFFQQEAEHAAAAARHAAGQQQGSDRAATAAVRNEQARKRLRQQYVLAQQRRVDALRNSLLQRNPDLDPAQAQAQAEGALRRAAGATAPVAPALPAAGAAGISAIEEETE